MIEAIIETKSTLDLSSFETVAVIDDVFDPPDSTRLNKGEIAEFLSALENDEEAQEQMAKLNISVDVSATDIPSDVLQELWKHYQDETKLGNLCKEKLFVQIIQDLDPVSQFCEYLHVDLGLEIITLGITGDFDELSRKPVKLIFIDYYFGPDISPPQIVVSNGSVGTNSPAQNRSIDLIKSIKKNNNISIKPFVILMSSKDVNGEMIAQFRDATGWLEGMFQFISKSDFGQKLQLSILLGALAKSLPLGHKVQSFVDVLETSLNKITENFLRDIRTLSLTDYAYIQKLSLSTEGHPLGDYMLWLYGSYLNYLVFENEERVSQKCTELDRLSFMDFPTLQIAPSPKLVKIYKSALFDDHVGDVADHPLTTFDNSSVISSSVKPSDELVQPYLQLGDLFVEASSKKVLMVINAQCDLAFTPGGKRKMPSERSIILIQGQMQPLCDSMHPKQMRTDLFEYANENYRILWETKQIVSYPYANVVPSLRKDGYVRVARLRELYALEIQQVFASNLTRVGMPVSPPAYQPLDVSIFCRDGKKYKCLMIATKGYAYLARTRESEENCILTFDLIKKIVSELSKLGKATNNYDENWLQLLTPFELNNEKEKAFQSLSVKIRRGRLPEQDYNHQESIFVLVSNLLDVEEIPDV